MSIKRIWHRSLYGASFTFHCGSCNYEVKPEWRFCPCCGSEIGNRFMPEKLKGMSVVKLLSITPQKHFDDADSPVDVEFRTFDMGVPEFLIYRDLVGLIHEDLNQVDDALSMIAKSPEFPKDALAISNLIDTAIYENNKTWKGIDSVFESNREGAK